jgi:hypothetical protein
MEAVIDEKTVAEPSAAAGAEFTQYDSWDEHGTPIVTKKPDQPKTSEEPAASASSAKETDSGPKGKSAADAETATSQENQKDKKERKPGEKKSADERIAELIAENKRLKESSAERDRSRSEKTTQSDAKTDSDAKPEVKTEASSAKDAPPATYADWRKAFKPKEWIEQWAKDNPSAGYEDAVAALGDFQADMRARYQQFEQLQQQGRERAAEMLRKTVEKYPDAEAKVKQTATSLMQPEVPPFVKALIDESEVMTDLLYTLSDPTTLKNFLDTARTKPGKAIRVLRDMELEITKAVTKSAASDKNEKSDKSEKSDTPAEPKPRAPKPPSEVGGRGTGHEDAAVAAARSGDYRAFEAAENAKMQARFKR